MLRSYLKLIFRNLWKNKSTSAINLTGLTIGISCSLLLLVYVRYETSFDNFSTELDNVYFHYYEQKGPNARNVGLSSHDDYEDLVANYASIKDALKLRNNRYNMMPEGDSEKKLSVKSWFATPNFFNFFDFPLIRGNADEVLSDPSSIVITEDVAARFFGDENPIGKTLTIDASSFKKDLIVTGIAKSIKNSHIQFEAIIPWGMKAPDGRHIPHMWFQSSLYTYVKTAPETDLETLQKEVNAPIIESGDIEKFELFFHPVKDMYLGAGDIQFLAFDSGNKQTINSLFYIAIIILLVASINYVNLQTAKGIRRSLEVGVRKVLGAEKAQLIVQFLLEAIVLTLMAAVLSILLIDVSLPTFNGLTGKDFNIEFLFDQGLLTYLGLISLTTAVLSGVYPAFVLSSLKPVRILKSSKSANTSGSRARRTLILAQFGISIFLISVTYIAFQQTRFINNKDLGFNKDQVITFSITEKNIYPKVESFRKELDQHPGILSTSLSTDILGDGYTNNSGPVYDMRSPDVSARVTVFGVDHEFTETYDMEILDGRAFDAQLESDVRAIIVNEAAVKALGLEEPVGKRISLFRPDGAAYRIIGVVKDFNFQKLHNKIDPVVLRIASRNIWSLSARLSEGSIPETLEFIENKWNEFEPEAAWDYDFIDELFARFYENETRMLKATTFFSLVSIFLTALGLFGMATFVIERKVKEIGVRKVLGATLKNIQALILKEFLLLLGLSFLIVTPIAYFVGNEWLDKFAFRIDVTAMPFVLAAVLTLFIIISTVGILSYRAANSNPVDALRNE